MRILDTRVLALLVVAVGWFAAGVCGADVEAVASLTSVSAAATPEPTSERKGRIKAPDGEDRAHALAAAVDEDAASATTALTASTASSAASATTGDVAATGPGPVVVLVTGIAVIAVVALAFQKRQAARYNERDENDPMQQSLLYHDMDYAAM